MRPPPSPLPDDALRAQARRLASALARTPRAAGGSSADALALSDLDAVAGGFALPSSEEVEAAARCFRTDWIEAARA